MNWMKLTDPKVHSAEYPDDGEQVMFFYAEGDRYFFGKIIDIRGVKVWESDMRMHFPIATGMITHWSRYERVK